MNSSDSDDTIYAGHFAFREYDMNTILETIRKSKNSKTLPEYTAAFRIDGKLRRFHATVRVREGCAISFREPAIDRLLVNNIDQGKKSIAPSSTPTKSAPPLSPSPSAIFNNP